MAPKIFDGKRLAAHLLAGLKEDVAKAKKAPKLGIVLVGENPASLLYIARKREAAQEVGIDIEFRHLPESTPESILHQTIEELNQDHSVTGIIVQLPLPSHLTSGKIGEWLDPKKDVDGITPGSPFTPATARAIELILEHERIQTEGKYAVVVGRSRLVGLPIANVLLRKNATVTIAHSKTVNLSSYTRMADILVVAAGQVGLITKEMVSPGAIVLNIGITKQGQELSGDVDPAVCEIASFYTPVPGGVGPVTVASLLLNVTGATTREF